ncbi:MAG: twin-arginine translocase TatA/TatE family subunit [Pseudomonadota bacterium]
MHFSVMQLALILAIIVLLFGTKKLGNVGSDVGSAIRNFRSSLKEGQEESSDEPHAEWKHIEGEVANVSPSTAAFKFKKKA